MRENNVENYGWKAVHTPCSCGYLTPTILAILERLNVSRLLDAGCGNGVLCMELSKRGYQAVGVEIDKGGVEIAKSQFPGINFYNYGVYDDPADLLEQEEPFDAVVSSEVIEHLFSPHMLPQYAAQVLKKDGYLLVTTPYHGYLKNLVLSLLDHWDRHHTPLWHGGHIKFWSRRTLTRLLEDNGFRVIDFAGAGRFPYLWKSMVITAQKL